MIVEPSLSNIISLFIDITTHLSLYSKTPGRTGVVGFLWSSELQAQNPLPSHETLHLRKKSCCWRVTNQYVTYKARSGLRLSYPGRGGEGEAEGKHAYLAPPSSPLPPSPRCQSPLSRRIKSQILIDRLAFPNLAPSQLCLETNQQSLRIKVISQYKLPQVCQVFCFRIERTSKSPPK